MTRTDDKTKPAGKISKAERECELLEIPPCRDVPITQSRWRWDSKNVRLHFLWAGGTRPPPSHFSPEGRSSDRVARELWMDHPGVAQTAFDLGHDAIIQRSFVAGNGGELVTTLICWVGVDQRGPASLYLASDSRFTWTDCVRWDSGRKLYPSRSQPVVLGYCGDVLFSSHSVAQCFELIEGGLLYHSETSAEERLGSLEAFLKSAFANYPESQQRSFSVIYACRMGDLSRPFFFAGTVSWSQTEGWSKVRLEMPTESAVIAAYGSGRKAFGIPNKKWKESEAGRTSRSVFSAFCDHVSSQQDPLTGGPPQLVGIYIKKSFNSITFGIIYDNRRWLSGAAVTDIFNPDRLEWRDHLFQCCDGRTLGPLKDAQRQPRPKGAQV